VGPGDVLSMMLKRIAPNVKAYSVGNMEGVRAFLAAAS